MNEWERRLEHIEKEVAQLRDDMHDFRIVPDEDEDTRAGREMYEHLRTPLNRIGEHQPPWRCWQDELTDEGKTAWSDHAKAYIKRGEPTEEMLDMAMEVYSQRQTYSARSWMRDVLRAVLAPKETTKCTK